MAANIVGPPAGAPPLRQAFSLTRYSSVSLITPSLMAWNTVSAVISVIMLDGARNSSAFFSNSTLPLPASTRIAVGASPSKPPSSFLAPCTLLLAAYTTPLHPTATATRAAIRPRQPRPDPAVGLRETDVATAIWRCPEPAFPDHDLTAGSTANNTAFTRGRGADRIAAPVKCPYRVGRSVPLQNPRNKAEKRCLPHVRFPPTGSRYFCLSRA